MRVFIVWAVGDLPDTGKYWSFRGIPAIPVRYLTHCKGQGVPNFEHLVVALPPV